MAESSSEMLRVYRELRRLKREEYLIRQNIAFLESRIQVAIGDNCEMKGIAKWLWVDKWEMDLKRFEREQGALYQALYQQYKRNCGGRRFRLERVDLTADD